MRAARPNQRQRTHMTIVEHPSELTKANKDYVWCMNNHCTNWTYTRHCLPFLRCRTLIWSVADLCPFCKKHSFDWMQLPDLTCLDLIGVYIYHHSMLKIPNKPQNKQYRTNHIYIWHTACVNITVHKTMRLLHNIIHFNVHYVLVNWVVDHIIIHCDNNIEVSIIVLLYLRSMIVNWTHAQKGCSTSNQAEITKMMTGTYGNHSYKSYTNWMVLVISLPMLN